jgi:hypothetical protein
MNIFETLKKLSQNQRKPPMRIYKDENNQIVEEPLNLDSSASAYINNKVKFTYINNTVIRNPAKEIHDFMFGR